LGWLAMIILASFTSLASARYLVGGALMIPPPLKPNFLGHSLGFYLHIGSGSLALLIGGWQFLPAVRRAGGGLHRLLGGLYVTACTLGALAALTIAPGTNGGPVAAAGFMTLAILWLATTWRALAAILAGDVAGHRRWIFRSFALTLAGVTLRLYLPAALLSPYGFSPTYAAIAWLCWVPNLILADPVERWTRLRRVSPRASEAEAWTAGD
jgi:uncharacterized membrane protein